MSGWQTLTLGSVFEIARGGSPRPIDDYITDAADGINWVSISDATGSSKYITHTKRRIKPSGEARSRRVQPGDFLLTNSMSFGRPYIMQTSGCIHDGWLLLRPRQEIHSDYFYHLIGSDTVYTEFERLAAGATVKNLNIDLVNGVKVPVPPLPEQRRIAAILDEADALRAKRRATLAQLDEMAQAIFVEMFGDPIENPNGWPILRLSEVLDGIDSGWSPTCLDRPAHDGEWGVLKLGAITRCDFRPEQNKALPADLQPELKLEVRPGDLLFTRKNTYELVAAAALVRSTPPRLMLPDLIFRLRTKSGGRILPVFLHALLIFPTQRRAVQSLAGGSSGSMPNISKGRLLQLGVVAPPLELQRQFADRLNWLEHLKVRCLVGQSSADSLFTSLQHRAFRGEL